MTLSTRSNSIGCQFFPTAVRSNDTARGMVSMTDEGKERKKGIKTGTLTEG